MSAPLQLATAARGTVPAEFVRNLINSQSLTVRTVSGRQAETSIRLGNTGLARNLPQINTACADQARLRGREHAELRPRD
jgi:hypothetical protein